MFNASEMFQRVLSARPSRAMTQRILPTTGWAGHNSVLGWRPAQLPPIVARGSKFEVDHAT